MRPALTPLPFILFLLCLLQGCTQNDKVPESHIEEKTGPQGPFFNLQETSTPTLLEPSWIATPFTEYNGTFSNDGKYFFNTVEIGGNGVIMESHLQEDNSWTSPRVASFSGTYSDYDPLFAPKEPRLYFSSERPTPQHPEGGVTHIWMVRMEGDGWGEPQLIPLTGKGDYFSSITRLGEIYFNVWANGDIYHAQPGDTGYVIEALPDVINGRSDVGDPFISPDGDYLIFRGYFKEGIGRGDLYISFKEEGQWTVPQNLGEPINSMAQEMCPYVTTDGKWFIFASDRLNEYYTVQPSSGITPAIRKFQSHDNGQQNIYYCSAGFIEELRASALPASSVLPVQP